MRAARFLLPALCFLLYLAALHPTVSPYRDSGDMAAAAVTLGVAHPPGYPLYAAGGRAWLDLVPLGDAAYRLNVWSAACAAGALVLFATALARWGAGGLAAAAGVLFLGLAPAFASLAQVSEMYALNALFAAGLLLCWPDGTTGTIGTTGTTGTDWRPLMLAAFATGVGLANHQTLVLTVPATLLAFWSARGRLPGGRDIGLITLFGLLGLTLYLYLPIRSWQEPWLDWGSPRSPGAFLRVLTRADYGGLRLHPDKPFDPGWSTLLDALAVSWRAFGAQAGWAGLAVCALGLWARRDGPEARGAALAFLLSGPFFIFLSDLDPRARETLPILEPHLVLPMVFLALFFAWGVEELWRYRGKAAWLAAALAAVPAWRASAAHDVAWNRANFSAEDYGRALVGAIEPGGLVLDPDDPTAFALSYFQAARALRPDVYPLMHFRTRWGYQRLRERRPDLLPDGEVQSGQELYRVLLAKNVGGGLPVYADLPQKVRPPYGTFPQGWAYRVLPPGRSGDAGLWTRAGVLWELSRARPASGDFFTQHTLEYGASALNNLAVRALDEGRLAAAESALKKALAREPGLAEAWSNWGNALYRKGELGRAQAAYRESLRLKPDVKTLYNLGRTQWAAGDAAAAEKTFTDVLAQADEPAAANDLALIWLNRGEAERAAQAFGRILARRPDYRPSLFNLGLALARLKRSQEAADAFRAYRDTASDPADRAEAQQWLQRLSADPVSIPRKDR